MSRTRKEYSNGKRRATATATPWNGGASYTAFGAPNNRRLSAKKYAPRKKS